MKKRINFQFLKFLRKNKAPQNIYKTTLHKLSSQAILNIFSDIVKPFYNICLHTSAPENYINNFINRKGNQQQQYLINIAEQYTSKDNIQSIIEKYSNRKDVVFGLEQCIENGRWVSQTDKYDIIISDLQLHLTQNPQNLLKGYLQSLKEDGALIGCCYGQSTLRQLYWSYIMAENQRSGGISPKVVSFPSMGVLGNWLTSSHYHLCTLLNEQIIIQYQSVIDLLSVIQTIQESGYIYGRRKGVFKDVLLAMAAMYHGEFSKRNSNENFSPIQSTLQLDSFIGWKYSPTQQKPLRRGTQITNKTFIEELRQMDPELKYYVINEEKDDAQQIK